jgi:anti-anti-sigma factor
LVINYIPAVPRNDDVVWYLSVEQTDVDRLAIIAAEGRISERTSTDLQRVLTAAIDSSRGVVLELSGVDYISSAGLRMLEQAARRLGDDGRALVLCGLQDPVSAALTLAGPIPHLEVEPSRESAIERLRRS